MANVNDEIDRLESLSAFELRTMWRRYWKQPPPMRISKDMLLRGIAWKLQEQALGGIGKPEARKLSAMIKAAATFLDQDGTGDTGATGPNRWNNHIPTNTTPIALREGNRLVRDWNGTTHTVLVLASGFEWKGQQFASLSKIAEAITGAHWSGPRFFGLVKRSDKVDRSKDQGDANSFDRRSGVSTAFIKPALIEPATAAPARMAKATVAPAKVKPSVRQVYAINSASIGAAIAPAVNGANHE